MLTGCYSIRNTATGKRYVGLSRDIHIRWLNHKSDLRAQKENPKFQRAWNKYGPNVWEWEVLVLCEAFELARYEVALIERYGTFRDGYNATLGGERGEGDLGKRKPHSAAARKKIGDSKRGKPLSAEHRAKLSAAHMGQRRPHTEETKRKIGAANKGKVRHTWSQESRDKVRASVGTRGAHASARPCTIDGVTYACMMDAMDALGLKSYYHLRKLL